MTDQLPAPRPSLTTGARVAPLVPQNLEEAWRLSEGFAQSGLTPRGIDSPAKVMFVICGGAEVGFGPFQSLQSFALINNKLAMWGDAIPALLLSNGIKIKEWIENEDQSYPDNMTAHCEITRPDGQVFTNKFSVADAKKAKLWSKDGPWQTNPRRMLQMRARGFTARDGAADVMRGLAIVEEARDIPPEVNAASADAPTLTAEFVDAPKTEKKARASKAPAPIDPIEPTTVEAAAEPEPQPEPETPAVEEAPASAGIFAGPAPAGVLYILSTEEPGEDDRIQAYKDGQPFSRLVATEENLNKVAVYDTHPEATAEPSQDAATAEKMRAAAEVKEEAEEEAAPPEFIAYINAVEGAPTWADTRKAMQTFYSTDLFKGMAPAQQNHVRANTWDAVQDSAMADKPDQAVDVSAFRLWIEWIGNNDGMPAKDAAEAIEGTLSVLHDSASYKGAGEATQKAIDSAAEMRIAALRS